MASFLLPVVTHRRCFRGVCGKPLIFSLTGMGIPAKVSTRMCRNLKVEEYLMATATGRIRVSRNGATVDVLVEGQATVAQSLILRRFAEQQLAGGATSIRIDLRHGAYMDSTFLGDLLVLKRAVLRCGQGDFALLAPSPPCLDLLLQMHLDRVFPIRTAAEQQAGPWLELTGASSNIDALKRNVVQAHEELATLEGPAGEPFRAVVRCLAEAKETAKAP
jgi:anti-anti-sigma regulatory factor